MQLLLLFGRKPQPSPERNAHNTGGYREIGLFGKWKPVHVLHIFEESLHTGIAPTAAMFPQDGTEPVLHCKAGQRK